MKKLIVFSIVLFLASASFSQSLTGMWRGFYNTNGDVTTSKNGTAEFVLDIKIDGVKVTGHSYTFFNKRKEYIICKVDGTYNEQEKRIEVIETKVVKKKALTFSEVVFQKNLLKYSKSGNMENLVGTWIDAKNSNGDGGKTTLQRYIPDQKDDPAKIIAKTTKKQEAPSVKKDTASNIPAKDNIVSKAPETKQDTPPRTQVNYKKDLVITQEIPIEIKSDSITVSIYDNGEVDGDTATFIFNGKTICDKKMISESAITFKLKLDEVQDNELVFIPNNEGRVSPNTGVAIIYDGVKRKEVFFRGKAGEATVYKITNNNKNLATIK